MIIQAIMMRSFLPNPAPELHSVLIDVYGNHHVRTWADVMEDRRKHQRERLREIRYVNEWKPYKVWVAYFDQWCMGGWQAYIENLHESHWIDRDRPWLINDLMRLFPLTIDLRSDAEKYDCGAQADEFRRWKMAFASQFKRRTQDRRPLGVAYVWWNGRDTPRRAM